MRRVASGRADSERQVQHLAARFVREHGSEDEREVGDANTDAGELVRVNDGGKGGTGAVQPGGFREKVIVLRKEHAPEGTGAEQDVGIGQAGGAVVLSGEDIVAFASERPRDGEGDMDIHVRAAGSQGGGGFDLPQAALRGTFAK